MEPIDQRVTAARLMALRNEPDGAEAIAALLQVHTFAPGLAAKTTNEINAFMESGNAVLAAQLVHAATVRRKRSRPTPR